ncbi:MarR family winged helix-turn-helix transcriptional regulator [Nocardioides sp.]|uniref:MarR family winged helix-turn-helix transcriptional regulator n=1 Tax=Nocardioides sp. TaxID=35761 RepID=UPI0035112FCC
MAANEHSPSLLYAVKQVELAIRSRLDDLLRPSGITALQYTALTVLRRREGLTAAALARNSFVATQSMADLVGALQRQGLIDRHRDPDDRRRMLIVLTDAGRAVLERHDEEVVALEREMTAGLASLEVAALRTVLNRCRENLGPASR